MKKIKKIIFKIIKYITLIHLIFFILMGSILFYISKYNPPVTSLMFYRGKFCDHDVKPIKYTPLKDIPNDFKKMLISTEDYKFYEHHGIDLEAIQRAYVINKKVGYRLFGGSTLTQQISRTLFLIPKKLLIRKYLEVLIALEMDLILSKDRILELYLNYCEWGKGIFGLSLAAEFYFNKEIKDLTIDESSRLITILANPILYSPFKFMDAKLLSNRYYMLKFRYYTYQKFNNK